MIKMAVSLPKKLVNEFDDVCNKMVTIPGKKLYKML